MTEADGTPGSGLGDLSGASVQHDWVVQSPAPRRCGLAVWTCLRCSRTASWPGHGAPPGDLQVAWRDRDGRAWHGTCAGAQVFLVQES